MRLLVFILMFWFYSCNADRVSSMKRDELWSMIRGGNQNEIIIAINEIQKRKDTMLLDAILFNSDDARISHLWKFYGKSIYQIKMEAIMNITGIDPPKVITDKPDSSIINFYSSIVENFGK
jgi:hypothetical protein